MNTVFLAIAGVILFMVIFIVPSFWRLIRWELAWDWRIARFGWHTFLFGVLLGAVGCFVLILHERPQLLGGGF